MLARATFIVAVGTLLAGCVDSERLPSNLGGPPAEAESAQDPSKQTVASKVLGAIALERVTKRKPDPARLNQLH
jgi:hypothetical protein